MRKVVSALTMCLLATGLQAQDAQPALDSVLAARKRSFLPVPVLGYSPEKGLEFGVVALYSYYGDKKNPSPLTRNSSASVLSTFTTNSQFKVDLRFENWTRDNLWHIRTNFRYHDFPAYFFGIGDTTHYADRSLVGNRRYKISAEAERRVSRHFYAGMSLLFQHDVYESDDPKGVYPSMDLIDKSGGHFTFIGATGIFDNRDNQNYTTKGSFVRLNVSWAPSFLSSQALWRVEGKASHFIPLSKKSTLGLNGYAVSTQGDVPFYMMGEMGNDNIMRGYYTGRYRDKNYMAAQAEYRYFLDPRVHIKFWFIDMRPTFALAGFAGAGTVFSNSNIDFSVKPNYGGGIRWFYDKTARLTVRLDYGVGEQRAGEKRQGGFYLSIAEAF